MIAARNVTVKAAPSAALKTALNTSIMAAALALAMALTLALAAGPARAAPAAGLVEVWQAALQNDREYAVARAGWEAALPKRDQATALWRPNVLASTTVGVATQENDSRGVHFNAPGIGESDGVGFNTSVHQGTSSRVAISAVQPLYSLERRARQQQLALAVEMAEVEWQAARQTLMLRTAQRYFDLALAEESLRVLQQQEAAVQRASDEAQDRFKLGSVPVTDTHEAAARLAAVRAQVLAAAAELQVKRGLLADSTGLPAAGLTARLPADRFDALPPKPLQQWLAQAATANLTLRSSGLALQLARQEAARHSVRASVAVDLVAQLSRDRLSGSGDFGSAGSKTTQRMVGVQLTVPLFTGGYRSAKSDEAWRLVDKAAAQLDLSRQEAAQQVRTTWLQLDAGVLRLQALAEGMNASQSRRDATQLGQQVGDRTTQDLLNAENDQATARLALLTARVGLALQALQLKAAAGELDEAALRALDRMLDAPAAAN